MIRATCTCSAPIMVRNGAVVCAACSSAIIGVDTEPTEPFTSLLLPPHTTRRAFRERCSTIPTATKTGHVWSVPRADWFASFRAKAPTAAATPIRSDVDVDVDAMLAAAGLRQTLRRSA